jgi:hypothetical protein
VKETKIGDGTRMKIYVLKLNFQKCIKNNLHQILVHGATMGRYRQIISELYETTQNSAPIDVQDQRIRLDRRTQHS